MNAITSECSDPDLSVVIPTRNRARLLEASSASALAQTYRALEVIIVDDASDDSTPSVVSSLQARDPRVRSVRLPRRGGAQAARNRGIADARAPVVAFLDDDCLWEPTKVEKQLAVLSDARGVAYCRHAIRHGEEWVVEGEPGAACDPVNGLLRKNYIGTYTVLARRELLEAVGGFDESLARLQDWDLLLRLGRLTGFGYIPEILVHGRQLSTGITMDRPALVTAANRMVESHAPFLSRRQLAALHYGLGKYLLVDGMAAEARRHFLLAVRRDPLAAAHWAGGAASLLGPEPARWIRRWRRHRRAADLADDGQPLSPEAAPRSTGKDS